MAEQTESKTGGIPANDTLNGRSKPGTKRRVDASGRACPAGLYIRDTSGGPVWHAKVQARGQSFDGSTGILESDPNSRAAAQEWVADKKAELRIKARAKEVPQGRSPYAAPPPKQLEMEVTPPPAPAAIYIPDDQIETARRMVQAVAGQEIERFESARKGSPHCATVALYMERIIEFFGPETDVSTIKQFHVNAYIKHRREHLTQRKTPVTYETIYRELEAFQRGIQCANDDEVFSPRYKLPINAAQRKQHLRDHVMYDDQRNHSEYTHAECSRWINAARGHKIYHFFKLAYQLGMRKHEIEHLRWSNIVPLKQPQDDSYVAAIVLPQYLYKLQKELLDNQPLPISRALYEELKAVYEQRQCHPDEPLFGRLSNSARTCEKLQKTTGLYIHLRDLRGCSGRRKLEMTGSMRAAQIFLRHKSLSTTERIYVRSGEQERAAVARHVIQLEPANE